MVSSRVRDQGVGFPSRMNLASKGLGFGVYQVVPTCLTGCGRFLSLPAKWCFIFRTDGKTPQHSDRGLVSCMGHEGSPDW